MATLPTPVPLTPQFGVGLFQANQTFQALAGYRWSYPTAQAPVWGLLDAGFLEAGIGATAVSTGGVVLPAGYITAAGEQGLSNATAGMSHTQHAHTAPMIQHAQVLEGLGQAIEAAAAYGQGTRTVIKLRTVPKIIYRYVKPNLKAALAPLNRRADAADKRARLAAKRQADLQHRIAKLERLQGHERTVAIPGIIGELDRLKRRGRSIEKQVQKLGKAAGIGAFLLLLAKALEKIGGNYIRCSNTKQWGKNMCGMNPSLLENLIAETLLVVGTIDLVDFALVERSVLAAAANPIRHFWRADNF